MTISPTTIAKLPKVVLHDHLDGGLRPATIIDLAHEIGYELPATEPDELAAWFVAAADSGSLERYLETFAHTGAVTQTAEALRRIASEAVIDLAADGVVYAELRFAPEQHLTRGLTIPDVLDAVREGISAGEAEVLGRGQLIHVGIIVCAMRQSDLSQYVAEMAVVHRDKGVVGFDLAGPEAGFPPAKHLSAFEYLRQENFPFTIHAGEAAGVESMWEAVQVCGAVRLGHGVRLMDDIDVLHDEALRAIDPGDPVAAMGPFAHWVRDQQIPLELCPSSNLQTGAAESIAKHPITLLKQLDFAVTVNTDNRLVSATSMSKEMTLLAADARWGIDDLRDVTINAALGTFQHYDEKVDLIQSVIMPGFDEAAIKSDSVGER